MVLLDTSVLGRLVNTSDAMHAQARASLGILRQAGATLVITAQILIEFRNFATRPKTANGLGITVSEAVGHTSAFEISFPLLAETSAIYPAWRAISDTVGVLGKQVHDARLVAVCHVHGVSDLLTFNVSHFRRFSTFGPCLKVLDAANNALEVT
jgi:predicted nucleic acid-binding protein